MSYKLEYPYTEEERENFIVEYNHNQLLEIETVDNFVEVEKTREITEERETIDEETGEVIDTEIVVTNAEVYKETTNYPTYFALEAWEKLVDGEVIDNTEEWEEEQKRKGKERIAMLNLTAADVERGIYKARGMDFEDIINFILTYPQDGLDLKALRIELKANHFYRGNVYVNVIGNILGFTSEQLDKFFEDGNYEHLLNVNNSEPTGEENPIVEDVTDGEDVDNSESGGK